MPELLPGSPDLPPFLSLLTSEQRRRLVSAGGARRFGPGEALFHSGDPTRHVLLLHEGWVKVVGDARDGGRFMFAIRGPGDILGELSAVDGRHRGGTVRTFTPVRATVIAGNRFLALVQEDPEFSFAVLRYVVGVLRQADEQRARYRTASGHMRTVYLLADLSVKYRDQPESRQSQVLPLSQEDLADAIGMSRQTVAHSLARLRNEGVIRTGRKRITIVRPVSLHEKAYV